MGEKKLAKAKDSRVPSSSFHLDVKRIEIFSKRHATTSRAKNMAETWICMTSTYRPLDRSSPRSPLQEGHASRPYINFKERPHVSILDDLSIFNMESLDPPSAEA